MDVATRLSTQINHCLADVERLDQRYGKQILHRLAEARMGGSIFRELLVHDHRAVDTARVNGIHPNVLLPQTICIITHQPNNAVFGRGVARAAMAHSVEPDATHLQTSRGTGDDDCTTLVLAHECRSRG